MVDLFNTRYPVATLRFVYMGDSDLPTSLKGMILYKIKFRLYGTI